MRYVKALCNRFISLIHCIVVKILHGRYFKFGLGCIIAASAHLVFEDKGKIFVGKGIGIRRGTELTVAENGEISIGDKCFFNKNCLIACHDKIVIGERTKFGPNVLVYDHDYEFRNREMFLSGIHNCSPVIIGKHCWIGAGTIILKGTVIGDDCVIGAGCVVKGKIPDGSILIQKRFDEVSHI